jgi:hypothetical protein
MEDQMSDDIRELSSLEVDSVSGGEYRLDFGIVVIDFMFPSIETGPMSGAWICGNNGCTSKIFGP